MGNCENKDYRDIGQQTTIIQSNPDVKINHINSSVITSQTTTVLRFIFLI